MGLNDGAPLRATAGSAPAGTATAASSTIVGSSKIWRGWMDNPSRRARETIWMLRIESPPSSK
jgi:hypothetical protein